MKNLDELSDLELIKAIKNCDNEIIKFLTHPSIDFYPGAIMGLGDFYVEKYILMNELYNRKQLEKENKTNDSTTKS